MAPHQEQEAAVLRANERFYEAFEQLDIEAMSMVWLHSNRARCVHPGWRTLRGWSAIKESWIAIFSNTEEIKFTLTCGLSEPLRPDGLGELCGKHHRFGQCHPRGQHH